MNLVLSDIILSPEIVDYQLTSTESEITFHYFRKIIYLYFNYSIRYQNVKMNKATKCKSIASSARSKKGRYKKAAVSLTGVGASTETHVHFPSGSPWTYSGSHVMPTCVRTLTT